MTWWKPVEWAVWTAGIFVVPGVWLTLFAAGVPQSPWLITATTLTSMAGGLGAFALACVVALRRLDREEQRKGTA